MLKKITFLSLFFVTAAFAAGPSHQHELKLNITESALVVGSGSTSFALGAGYNYGLTDMFQVGGRAALTASSTSTTFTLLGGATLNLNLNGSGQRINYADALFVKALIGVTVVGAAASFTFEGTVGKRFAVLKNLAYTPELGLIVAGSVAFVARPLQFSALF